MDDQVHHYAIGNAVEDEANFVLECPLYITSL